MVKSSIYFLSLIVLGFTSCSEREWYKLTLSEDTQEQYALQVRRGRVYHYQGSVPEQHQVKESLEMNSSDADTWREMGTARVKRAILDEMDYYYGGAVERKPEKWAGFRGYLYLYFYRDFPRAIADFNLGDKVAGQVQYSQGQSHDYMRGICYYGLEDYEASLTSLSKYIDLIVSEEGEEWVDVYAFLYRGLALAQLERYEEALDDFDRTLKYYPNLSDCFYHKAKILAHGKEHGEALKLLSRAKEYLKQGYYHQRPYVEVLEQVYLQDIEELEEEINAQMLAAS